VRKPVVRVPPAATLRGTAQRADWLLVAPRELLPAAEPLAALRRTEGLRVKLVALEEIASAFGHGEATPEALRDFLEYAYQRWRRPSFKYVVLLGDGTYDRKNYLGTGVKSWIPPYTLKTSYLWTASDPAYGSVNGDDLLPDVAVGRLPAASLAEARTLVDKVVAFENAGRGLGGRAVSSPTTRTPAAASRPTLTSWRGCSESGTSRRSICATLGRPRATPSSTQWTAARAS
jgi:hypothetical protein